MGQQHVSTSHDLGNRAKELVSVNVSSNYDYIVKQWVSEVVQYSSEYPQWPASNVIGKPLTYPNYGDIKTAWAPLQRHGTLEFLELEYLVPVNILSLNVYETYNPGSLVKVSTSNEKHDEWDVVWEGEKEHQKIPEASRIVHIECQQDLYKTKYVRLDFDTYGARSWSEIDAVEMIGYLYDNRKKDVLTKILLKKKELNINFLFL